MITLAILLSVFALGSPPADLDTYTMNLALDSTAAKLVGTMYLEYTNDSEVALENIMLRLDLNLSSADTMVVDSVTDAESTPLEWKYGLKEFGRLASAHGILDVALAEPLQPGERTTLHITYQLNGARFLSANMLYLADDPYTSLDAWYPKAMSYIDGTWCDEDCRLATYDVRLRHDTGIDLAATGKLTEKLENEDGSATSSFHREGMRGFTIYGSKEWTAQEREIPGCMLRIHTAEQHREWAEPFLDVATEAVEYYRDYFGFFPTDHIELVCFTQQGSGAFAGHSVVGFFMGNVEKQYQFLVAHEVAHMYFGTYTSTPRDQIGWALIGLGLTADRDFLNAKGYPTQRHTQLMWYYNEAERRSFDTSLEQKVSTLIMSDNQLWRQAWNMCLSHAKGMSVCGMLRGLLGNENFNTAVRALMAESAGKLLPDAALVDACRQAYDGDLEWFIEDWVTGSRTIDYAITEVSTDDSGVWHVKIRNDGEARYPVKIAVTFANGANEIYTADISKSEESFILPPSGQPTSVVIDPDGITPDMKPDNNRWPVVEEEKK